MLGIGLVTYLQGLPMFGGEDPLGSAPAEDNWHHEGLTRQAARAAEWCAEAENALAFHVDYVDSYLYNPLWWFDVANGGGPDRLPVVMSSQSELVKVHFDDLIHPESVRGMWRRYLSGTAAGLVWLGHADSGTLERRVAMAQNLVGVSLHAIQDFYSHSNWIDDEDLRGRTWFEVDPDRRACVSLWTGSYELPQHLAIKPHGAYLYACTIINNLGSAGRGLMNVVCHAASPFANSSLCRWFKQCADAASPDPPETRPIGDIAPIDPPRGIVWVEPGINVDSRWMADVGVQVRGLSITGREAFERAYELAFRSSCQWLHILDHVMGDADLDGFWHTVKSQGTTREQYKSPTAPWEDFSQIPYRFISAGPYPPPQVHDDTEDWYLRLLIRTAGDAFSGTDADIVPFVNGRRFPILDHGVPPSPPPVGQAPSRTLPQTLMGHNDFEAGDVAAYIIGPIDEAPHTVALLNDARDAGETIVAALEALWVSLVRALEAMVEFLKGLWGYHADFVDEDHVVISASTLDALGVGQRHWFSLSCDGRSEGNYRISGHVEGTSETGSFPHGVRWRRYRVRFEDLHCIKESDWDRFTTSDEPFVLGLVIPHGGTQPMISWRTAPYGDVDSGETRSIGRTFTIEVPQRYGFISLACAVYESDDETPNDRDRLLAEFAGTVGSEIVEAEDTFLEVLGESVAAGWRLSSIEAVAFRRSPTVEVRSYQPRTFDRWVEGGDRVEWTLSEQASWSVDVPDTISCGCEACAVEVVLPPVKPKTSRVDFSPKPGGRRKIGKDAGREIAVDLADLDPRCRRRVSTDDPVGDVDEVPAAPRPSDGCP
jgi:hypothetical protein